MTTEKLSGMIVFSLVFLGLFIALIGIKPSEFYWSQARTYQQYEYPDYFTQEDIQYIRYFINKSVTRPAPWYPPNEVWFDFTTKGANLKIIVTWYGTDIDKITFERVTWEWWIFFTASYLTIDDFGGELTKQEVISKWDDSINASVIYPVYDDVVTLKVWITDSNETRNNINTAWDEGNLFIGIGFGFEDLETKLSAWDIIGRLLTFQSPEIFGLTGATATVLNLVIALPLWGCVAYLITRLILLFIPFAG